MQRSREEQTSLFLATLYPTIKTVYHIWTCSVSCIYFQEIDDLFFLLKSKLDPLKYFSILGYVFSCQPHQAFLRSSLVFHKLLLYPLTRLWNFSPTIDITQCFNSIEQKTLLWTHFIEHLNPQNPCSCHFLGPFSKRSTLPYFPIQLFVIDSNKSRRWPSVPHSFCPLSSPALCIQYSKTLKENEMKVYDQNEMDSRLFQFWLGSRYSVKCGLNLRNNLFKSWSNSIRKPELE